MEININVDVKDKQFAGILANQYGDISEQKKVFVSSLGVCAFEKYLKNCSLKVDKNNSLFRIKNILQKTDIFDINYNGKTIDVRTFVHADALYIPKKHFVNNTVAQYYVFAIYDEVVNEVKIKGCISAQNIDKNRQTVDYYVVSESQLAPVETLVLDLSQLPKQNNDYKVDEMSGIFAALLDGTLDSDAELKIINYMYNLDNFRCQFTDFAQFEEIASKTAQYPDLFEPNSNLGNDLYVKEFVKAGLSEYMPQTQLSQEEFEELPELSDDADEIVDDSLSEGEQEQQDDNSEKFEEDKKETFVSDDEVHAVDESDISTTEKLLKELEEDEEDEEVEKPHNIAEMNLGHQVIEGTIAATGAIAAGATVAGAQSLGAAAGEILSDAAELAAEGVSAAADLASNVIKSDVSFEQNVGDVSSESDNEFEQEASNENEMSENAEIGNSAENSLFEDAEFSDSEITNDDIVNESEDEFTVDEPENEEIINKVDLEDNILIENDDEETVFDVADSNDEDILVNESSDDLLLEENESEVIGEDDGFSSLAPEYDDIEIIDDEDDYAPSVEEALANNSDIEVIQDEDSEDEFLKETFSEDLNSTSDELSEISDEVDDLSGSEDDLYESSNLKNEFENIDETHYPLPQLEEVEEPTNVSQNFIQPEQAIQQDNSQADLIDGQEHQELPEEINAVEEDPVDEVKYVPQNVAMMPRSRNFETPIGVSTSEEDLDVVQEKIEEQMTKDLENGVQDDVFEHEALQDDSPNEKTQNEFDYGDLNTLLNELETISEQQNVNMAQNAANAAATAALSVANAKNDAAAEEVASESASHENIKTLFDENDNIQDELDVEQSNYGQYMQEAEDSRKKTNIVVPILAFCILSMGAMGGYWAYNKYNKEIKSFFTKSPNVASTAQMKSIDEFDDETFMAKGSVDSALDDKLLESDALEPNPDGMDAQDLNQSITSIFDDTLYPVTISKIAWEVPDSYLSSASFKKYLNIAGVQLQRELQTNLAKVNDVSPSGKIKLSFKIYADNSIKDIKILETSGVDDIDKISKKCIVDTLTYIKIPVIPSSENFVTLTLAIIF